MGFFGHWVVVRGAGRVSLRRLGLDPAATEAAAGWRYAYGEGIPDDLETLVVRAARLGDGAALGAWVFDSDYAHVIGVDGDGRAAVAIWGDRAEVSLEHDPEALARWSACAPRSLTALEIHAIAERHDVFAEQTVDELFDQLGLPAPYDPLGKPSERPRTTRVSIAAEGFGGYVAPLGLMTDEAYINRVRIPWRELRHVPGLGAGFLGIWDRDSPEGPIATFPVSRRGEARLEEELERLQVPVRVGAMNATGLGGFAAPIGLLAEERIAERDIRLAVARFVPGRGEDFIGIWDRRRPEEPIERFRPDDFGGEAARKRVQELLFEELLSTKATPGRRMYRPPGPKQIIRHEPMEAPRGLPAEQRRAWDESQEHGVYSPRGGTPWLLVEEDPDEDWRVVMDGEGRYYVYAVGLYGPLACRGRFPTVDRAMAYVAEQEGGESDWRDVPAHVPANLLASYRWAERERSGDASGPWYERFEWVESSTQVGGRRWGARVVENGTGVGAVLVAEKGLDDEAAAYLFRAGDGPRLIYSLDSFDVLASMLENLLGDVGLDDWFELTEEWPADLGSLLPPMLLVTGVIERPS